MIRRGEVSSRELVELYLERIERLDPRAELLPRGARRARAGRRRAGRRPARRRRRPAAAGRSDRGQGHRGHRRRGDRPRDRRLRRPGAARQRLRRAAARGRRGDPRQDQPARAGDHGLHGGPRLRRSRATPGTPTARPGGSSGGSAAAVAAGLCAAATALGRRRLDPDPGLGLRAGRPQAAARPHLARVARRALVRAQRARLPDPYGGRHGPAARRGRGAAARAAPTPPPRRARRRRLRVAMWFKTPFPPVPLDEAVRASIDGVADALRTSATRWSRPTRTTGAPPTP